MDTFGILFKDKGIKYLNGTVLLILCGTRLVLPISNYGYLQFLFSMIIFTILPIGLWWYIQKITKLFNSSYARVRLKHLNENIFFLNVLVNEFITISFVLVNASFIFILTFGFKDLNYIPFFIVITIYWMCIYLIFINIFHLIYYASKELKSAFFASYIFLFMLTFVTSLVSSNLFDYTQFNYVNMLTLIFLSCIILFFIHIVLFFLSKGTCRVYDKDKS